MSDERDEEIAALKARLEQIEGRKPEAVQVAQPAAKKSSGFGKGFFGCFGVLAAIALCVLTLAFCSAWNIAEDQRLGEIGQSRSGWTPPEGFVLAAADRGGAVGTKWFEPTREECGRGRATCAGLEIVSEKGCPRNLYASILLLDANGANIGWTNDTAQGVQPNQIARLVFRSYQPDIHTTRIAEINCY